MSGKCVMIGYDLNRPGQDYEDLHQAIKDLGSWWHCLDSTWVIRTEKSSKQIRDELRRYIDATDELLVARLSGEAAWAGFNGTGSSWLKDNL